MSTKISAIHENSNKNVQNFENNFQNNFDNIGERAIVPKFDDLDDPRTIKESITQLKTKIDVTTPHAEILVELLKHFEWLDFQLLVFPQVKSMRDRLKALGKEAEKEEAEKEAKELQEKIDKLKLNQKHYLILAIENVLAVAKSKKWGLCKSHEFIYVYNGEFWAEIDKEALQKFLGEAAEKMGVTKFEARFHLFRKQLLEQFISTAYLPAPQSVNKDTVLVNLQNGTFEISPQGTRLRPFDRSDFITYQLPFRYDPKAKAPIFQKYLDRVLPDTERQMVLAEYLGYIFIKHGSNTLKEEKALILYGEGANGKSVFFEVVTALLGRTNVSNYSLQSLTEDKGFYRAKIVNKLVNYASEINGKLEASLFKAMVSGEPVEACPKYGQPFTMTDYAKFIFNCNELPKDVEHTNAYFRRFLIIPFGVTIPEHEQDKNLHAKIIETELSGVFNWVLEGLSRLLEQKRFSNCEAARKALEQYKVESNSVHLFLNENGYKVSAKAKRAVKDLYSEYRLFCNDDGMSHFKKSNFLKQLRALGFVVDRGNGNILQVSIER